MPRGTSRPPKPTTDIHRVYEVVELGARPSLDVAARHGDRLDPRIATGSGNVDGVLVEDDRIVCVKAILRQPCWCAARTSAAGEAESASTSSAFALEISQF
jgi:hypothetical protein